MTLSPPATILALLAVGVAGVTWFAPPQPQPPYVAVQISVAAYDKLAALGKDRRGPASRPLTVAQVIEALADSPAKRSAP